MPKHKLFDLLVFFVIFSLLRKKGFLTIEKKGFLSIIYGNYIQILTYFLMFIRILGII